PSDLDQIDADELKLREHVAADEIRRGEQQQQQQSVPEDLSAVLEQADVLRVVGLEEKTHLHFLPRRLAENSRRHEQQNDQHDHVGRNVLEAFRQIED